MGWTHTRARMEKIKRVSYRERRRVVVCAGPVIAAVIFSLLPATVITVVDMVLRAL